VWECVRWSFRGLDGLYFYLRMNNTLCQVTQTFRLVHNPLGSGKRGAARHFLFKKRVIMRSLWEGVEREFPLLNTKTSTTVTYVNLYRALTV
jgi:hypothetical protein